MYGNYVFFLYIYSLQKDKYKFVIIIKDQYKLADETPLKILRLYTFSLRALTLKLISYLFSNVYFIPTVDNLSNIAVIYKRELA
jgi:hypothetical protein